MGFKVRFDDKRVTAVIRSAAADGLEAAGKALLEESQRLCPKERGFNGGLVSTAFLDVDREALVAVVGYTAKHAHLQHEKTHYKHKSGEQAKFLEEPMTRNARAYLDQVARTIKRQTGS